MKGIFQFHIQHCQDQRYVLGSAGMDRAHKRGLMHMLLGAYTNWFASYLRLVCIQKENEAPLAYTTCTCCNKWRFSGVVVRGGCIVKKEPAQGRLWLAKGPLVILG